MELDIHVRLENFIILNMTHVQRFCSACMFRVPNVWKLKSVHISITLLPGMNKLNVIKILD